MRKSKTRDELARIMLACDYQLLADFDTADQMPVGEIKRRVRQRFAPLAKELGLITSNRESL